jgi:RHS repeat-associated protein
MDLDYTYGYLKIFASNGAVEYTEFAGAVPSWTKSYVYLGSSQLSTITPNGSGGETTEYNHPDRLGIRTVTNQTAGTSYEQTTLPFGTALNSESTGSTSQRFTSYERSARTGLDYAVNRTYDSKLGRFSQVDPIGMKAVNLDLLQTLNLYTYCGNDPVNHIDPDGLFFKWLGKLFSKIGRVLNRIFGNIVVQIALTVLAAVVTFGTSLIATLGVFMPALTAPAWLTVTSWVSTIASYASRIATVLEISGLLLQGKFKQFGKIIGMAFVGALVGVVEDSVRNGFWEGLKQGKPFSGAWKGFKKGLGYLKEIFTRRWRDLLLFPVYGNFCGAGWGIDINGNTSSANANPTDQLDGYCKKHDDAMRNSRIQGWSKWQLTQADLALIGGALTASVRSRLVDRYFGNGYKVGNVFRTTVVYTFSIRIGGRYLGVLR